MSSPGAPLGDEESAEADHPGNALGDLQTLRFAQGDVPDLRDFLMLHKDPEPVRDFATPSTNRRMVPPNSRGGAVLGAASWRRSSRLKANQAFSQAVKDRTPGIGMRTHGQNLRLARSHL